VSTTSSTREEVDDVKNLMQPMTSAIPSLPVAAWRPVSELSLCGLERRSVTTVVTPVPAHGAKSVLGATKRGATSGSNGKQRNGYGFGAPAGVDAPRIDTATGLPPRSWPV
jgi:hypothetical protein